MSARKKTSPPARAWRDRYALYLALLVAWVAMLGSLYFSNVRHYTPCLWCWYQRILMYPLALGVLPIGLLRRDEELPYFSLFFSGLGMAASTYHYLLQKTNWFLSGSSCDPAVPCNMQYINWAGFITIPFLALSAFTLIFFASLVVITSRKPLWDEEEVEERAPWLPVLATIGVVLLAFAPSFLLAQPVEATATPADSSTLASEGEQVYLEACAACHGPAAEGIDGLGAPLAGAALADELGDAAWIEQVQAGIPADHPLNDSGNPMPAIARSDAELQAVLDYLRTLE